jgi:hypothetical protein|tara:strand:- start:329 stop:523 length:195 start_codon:yes stop_codon:yes gene_type:complete
MNEIQIAQFVLDTIKKKKQQISDVLEMNGVQNMEHYRQLMGNLDGLNYLEQELKSLLSKQEQEQ